MAAVSRRTVLAALAAAGAVGALPGCAAPFAQTRLRLATGSARGVYYRLGSALARSWRAELGLVRTPVVLTTAGSLENVALLADGAAEVVFSQVDAAAERLVGIAADDPAAPRALARIYDDVLHVVVPADSPITTVSGLRGARVSVGAADSGVSVVARRLLDAAGLGASDVQGVQLGLDDSVDAMAEGSVDAFFWSGGLPTPAVEQLAAVVPIRLLDLTEDGVLDAVRRRFPVYAPGTVPARGYPGITTPVTTMLVRNLLLVAAAMPDDLARSLVEVLFAEQEQLAQAGPAALTIDPRAAIGTEPVLLHPGAEQFYRSERG
ncbi:TAXI family TRAP transporter solute-binding subunit [Pseudonocardia petroleophila]|uniref:TAXI family TRAP transporter solute-binding subunit n=1 Tax=Pseudonocardia petroleophila TaxID=37331 RepID=A0A7G7MB19_9PSEU|nr:TAXI family TRAP transporter solute-binding subunit [Pseudonocardia petroleophila]QNG49980.1 TAXI family TRAP transporter solute-binding subunit [Pseudonocardia petroleophila]